jgi:hypothetical protein
VESMTVEGGPTLHPIASEMTVEGLDGAGQAPLVDAGTGSEAELVAERVAGKVALVRLPESWSSLTSQMAGLAREAGAKALLLYRPAAGRWVPTMGSNPVSISAYALPLEEAEELADLLAASPGGSLPVSWKATARSPYVYNLGFTQSTPLTDDKVQVVQDRKLGRTEADYGSMGLEAPFLDYVHAQRPDGVVVGASNFEALPVPGKRTELYTDGGTPWLHFVISSFPFSEAMVDSWQTYPTGRVRTEQWYGGVIAPAAIKDAAGVEQLTAERQGELMGFAPQLWGDGYGHVANPANFGDGGTLELRRDGESLGTTFDPYGVFEVPAEDSRYELTLWQERYGPPARVWKRSTQIITTWGFRSALEPDVYSRGLPLLFPRVDLPEDGLKQLAPAAGQSLAIRVGGHAGYAPGDVVSAKLAWSYDGGTTWTDARMREEGGRWSAIVDHTGASGSTVATRVEVTDSKGATVSQTVQAAYGVR